MEQAMNADSDSQTAHRVVILGGGFGGLYAAKELGNRRVQVTLVDKRNFHLFQPLLYQVATGGLSPGEIASPLRAVLKRYENITVLQGEAVDLDVERRQLILADGEVPYDSLIVATGASHHYFGREHWQDMAPGLKTIEDALEMRRRILWAFEAAERETDPARRKALLTFVIVGAGPTGVELAGALAELAHFSLRHEYRHIDPSQSAILLLEGMERVLPTYTPDLSAEAEAALARLGVEVRTHTLVTGMEEDVLTLRCGEEVEQLEAGTVLWAAGMRASAMGQVLAQRAGAELDEMGRVMVQPDLTVPGHPEIFVAGDLANLAGRDGQPLPGVAPVAMQQGRYAARVILRRLQGRDSLPFYYRNRGSLAVIGRHAAVADLGFVRFGGFLAWLAWIFVHIMYLVGFENRILVFTKWAYDYFTHNRGARLITDAVWRPQLTRLLQP
jgi:NADH dehydrogenase